MAVFLPSIGQAEVLFFSEAGSPSWLHSADRYTFGPREKGGRPPVEGRRLFRLLLLPRLDAVDTLGRELNDLTSASLAVSTVAQ